MSLEEEDFEAEFILGWPDRKRLRHMTSPDAEGRVICARTPILEQEGLITSTDAFLINAQVQMPEPVHPYDWSVEICGEVDKLFTLTLDELKKSPARTVRAVTECADNDGDYFDWLESKTNTKPQISLANAPMNEIVLKAKTGAITFEEAMESPRATNLCSGGEWTGTPLKAILDRAGVNSSAVSVRLVGFDIGTPNEMKFYRAAGTMEAEIAKPGAINFNKALPINKAFHEDTIIAWAHKGEQNCRVH